MSKFYNKGKVVVGLSGGVDSAVSLYLLKKNSDLKVSAVFMQNWDDFLSENKYSSECTQVQDFKDALAVANNLNINLKRVNFIKEY